MNDEELAEDEPAPTSRPVYVFDFETTGTNPDFDNPCSYALGFLTQGGKVEIIRHGFCDPGMTISDEAIKIHGITNAMVAGSRSWIEVIRSFAPLFENADAAMAFNVSYDGTIFRRGCRVAGFDPPFVRWLDPSEWARSIWWGWKVPTPYPTDDTGKKRLRLTDLARFFDVKHDAHDATGDVLATGAILPGLRRCIEKDCARVNKPSPFRLAKVETREPGVPEWITASARFTRAQGLDSEEIVRRMREKNKEPAEPSRWLSMYDARLP